MLSRHLQIGLLVSLILSATALLGVVPNARSQDQIETPACSPIESVLKAEAEIELLRSHETYDLQNVSTRAWRRLKAIPRGDIDADLQRRIDADLLPLEEILGSHSLHIARFYLSRTDGGTRAAQSWLLRIVQEYPDFSGTDEVLMKLSEVSVRSKNPDEARNYLWRLVCRYPASPQTIHAFARLNDIGYGEWQDCEKYKQ
jgi:hypothetical protein